MPIIPAVQNVSSPSSEQWSSGKPCLINTAFALLGVRHDSSISDSFQDPKSEFVRRYVDALEPRSRQTLSERPKPGPVCSLPMRRICSMRKYQLDTDCSCRRLSSLYAMKFLPSFWKYVECAKEARKVTR